MKQALANLVDNAIKYSGERRRLRVAARRDGGDGVAVEVADEGIGIPLAERGANLREVLSHRTE